MSKHTPGPWIAARNNYYETWSVVGDDTVCDLCYMEETTHEYHDYENAEANARLIAAAPELLEALKGFLKVHEEWNADVAAVVGKRSDWMGADAYLEPARAAINKAEGGDA